MPLEPYSNIVPDEGAAYDEGYSDAVDHIVSWLTSDDIGGYHGAITPGKVHACEHGSYSWECCDDCTTIRIAAALLSGEWRKT